MQRPVGPYHSIGGVGPWGTGGNSIIGKAPTILWHVEDKGGNPGFLWFMGPYYSKVKCSNNPIRPPTILRLKNHQNNSARAGPP